VDALFFLLTASRARPVAKPTRLAIGVAAQNQSLFASSGHQQHARHAFASASPFGPHAAIRPSALGPKARASSPAGWYASLRQVCSALHHLLLPAHQFRPPPPPNRSLKWEGQRRATRPRPAVRCTLLPSGAWRHTVVLPLSSNVRRHSRFLMTHQPLPQIESALNALFAKHWLDALACTLSRLHKDNGQPAAPDATLERTPRQLPFLQFSKVGDLKGYEFQAVEAYNSGVKAAYLCIDWKFEGLLTALANDGKGSENWQKYYMAAGQEMDRYFRTGQAFEDFEVYILLPARESLGL
jgi:hypothetical protein